MTLRALLVSAVLLGTGTPSSNPSNASPPPSLAIFGSFGSGPVQFSEPFGLVEDQGLLYVADYTNHRVQVLTTAGQFVRAWGSAGFGPGEFDTPTDLALDAEHVYVVDGLGNRIQKFTRTGAFVAAWSNWVQGVDTPIGVAAGGGFVYVTDYGNSRIQKFTTDGTFVGILGQAGYGPGEFQNPIDVEVGPDGLLYVSDTFNYRVQVLHPDGAWIRSWGSQGTGEGQFSLANRIGFGPDGHVYVCDGHNDRIQEFEPDGSFVSAWGSTGVGPGQIDGPAAIDLDASGRHYVLERANNRIQVFGSSVTGVADRPAEWVRVSPNPSSAPITIRFARPGAGEARLTIVDLAGRHLGTWQLSGDEGAFVWDGTDRWGHLAPSGTYFARLQVGSMLVSRSFRLLR